MPKPLSIEDTVAVLNDDLRRAGGTVKTYPWPEFYKRCKVQRFKQERMDAIQELAGGEYSLIVAYGHNAVLVAQDRNFQP